MAINGPSVSKKKCCQSACMGPLSLQKYPADGQEWAQCFYQEMLPIQLHGPIIADAKRCRWPRMGPVFLKEVLPIRLHGPIIADEKRCRWPRMGPVFLKKVLPIRLHGPIIADEKCCRWL